MARTDEFTFPVITDCSSCSIESPPLWRLSPEKESNEEDEGAKALLGYCKDDEEEVKMDALWEDLNDELLGSSSSFTATTTTSRLKSRKRSGSGGSMVEMGCVQSLKFSRNPAGKNARFSSTKPGFVVFMKVLKKLFLLPHHSHPRTSVKNNRPW